ncbi:MAG TPA: hypothetical protein VFF36_19100, partial [Planctomycetota bacterium]|nr:hypothetical protein [Planctomycetota bacterium]
MRLQLLSDLHLETERYDPEPAPGAELLILAGDIDSEWLALERFAGWPQPVVFVAGNHEFDGRDLETAWPALRSRCEALGITLLECESRVMADDRGRRLLRQPDAGDPGRAAARCRGDPRGGPGLSRLARGRADAPAGRLGADDRHHPLRAQPEECRPALRRAQRHRQLLQCRRRPDPARRPKLRSDFQDQQRRMPFGLAAPLVAAGAEARGSSAGAGAARSA